jgi:hypothetical protein
MGKQPLIKYNTDKSDEREQITEAMNAYYNYVYSDENQEKARQALSESLREEYRNSHQDWEKVEESIMRSYELHKEFGPLASVVFYTEPEDEMKAVEICSHLWPDAVIESGSGEHDLYGFCHYVQVTFNQLSTTDK